ncbi:hypothetical protein [Leucobacter luti]|uniref:Uncharacterized protein n=1 Tax=Leucobacter luti TaxID=340320 RepID=A0A4Q7U2V8_9MICO|nr:hypothetical protein [Leucobacter luti]MBL3699565.1 hypothetical protein [Leucobacter luti]RZT67077.1 hypothetical protein EV139_1209 [Leucobacter luti]
MPSRHEAAITLGIPVEMAKRHGIPAQISHSELAELDASPPPWLAQSRANRTGTRPVWATLTCAVCGAEEHARPKKWWPEFTLLACDTHEPAELPAPAAGTERSFVYGVGSQYFGAVDAPTDAPTDAD